MYNRVLPSEQKKTGVHSFWQLFARTEQWFSARSATPMSHPRSVWRTWANAFGFSLFTPI